MICLLHLTNFNGFEIRVIGWGGVILEADMGEVISQDCPISPFFKLGKKWFYIGYIERIFWKTSLQNYRTVKTSPCFKFVGLPLVITLWWSLHRCVISCYQAFVCLGNFKYWKTFVSVWPPEYYNSGKLNSYTYS